MTFDNDVTIPVPLQDLRINELPHVARTSTGHNASNLRLAALAVTKRAVCSARREAGKLPGFSPRRPPPAPPRSSRRARDGT
ncbi:hypothetical protein NL676_030973 [Syzygium grande]|nr:hypothetical protein NL676_030973 [Syzygium grande]